MTNKKPEILAPCGNPAAFHAALSAGADAVYLALNRYGARAYAGNFQQDELLHALEEAHLHDMKVYLTLNTLLKNEELQELPEIIMPLYREGLDAVLVQDLGVAELLKECFPELPLHASTQMNLCSPEGALYVKRLGFSRVVPARELTIRELKDIRDLADIEVEAFVHGAMCVCYSGRCYLSSFAGGRSGNRGRCAQPCRQKYNGKYLLSMKDLCTLEDVPALMDAGIDSLKIEGRMKNEYYVAACVDAYKQMTEDCAQGVFSEKKAASYRERLAEVFHRGGFTRGYLNQTGGPNMLDENMPGRAGIPVAEVIRAGHGTVELRVTKPIHAGDFLEIPISEEDEPVKLTAPEDISSGKKAELNAPRSRSITPGTTVIRVRNAALTRELEQNILEKEPVTPVDLEVRVISGEPFRITARTKATSFSVEGPVTEPAEGKPVEDSMIQKKIGTLSGTGFVPVRITIENDQKSFLSISVIKQCRREVLAGLTDRILQQYRRELPNERLSDRAPETFENAATADKLPISGATAMPVKTICFAASREQTEALLKAGKRFVIYDQGMAGISGKTGFSADSLSIENLSRIRDLAGEGSSLLIGFPYIYRTLIPAERMEALGKLAECLDGAYISGIDSLAWFLNHGIRVKNLVLGAALYGYNDRAAEHFYKAARAQCDHLLMEAPYELSSEEIEKIQVPSDALRFTTVYGRLPLMLTMQRTGPKPEILKDRTGESLMLYSNADLCYNVLLSGRPVLQDAGQGISAYRFTTEDKETMDRILSGELPKGIRHQGLI